MCVLALMIVILAVSAVSAHDANQTENMGLDDSNVPLQQGNNSFADLDDDISNGTYQIDISSDYSFNQSKDESYVNGIEINQKELVINGNGHIIDAGSQARVFTINSSNITLSNLIIKNAVGTAIIVSNSTVYTNNVTFEGNVGGENGAAVYINNSNYTSTGDRFTDNKASRFGSAVFVKDNCSFNAINSTFMGNDMYWGLIEIRKSQFNIENCTFADSSSRYSTALHSEGGKGRIRNSKFMNLTASVTAGALAFKEFKGQISVENSIFSNVKSAKNAGAVFVDVDGMDSENEGNFTVSNCKFINCSSEFGGAILQLCGNLTISDSTFTANRAYENGAAIYTSWAHAVIDNVSFSNNNAEGKGGAIFFDAETLNVKNSNFTNNAAENGGAVYLYDSGYNISGSCFMGNVENIYSMFDKEIKTLSNNTMADGKVNLGNVDYKYSYDIKNIDLAYNPISYDLSLVNSSYFDLRELGLVSPVKAQGWMGSCWSFASAAALESAILKATNRAVLVDISENDLRNNVLKYALKGCDSSEGGDGLNGGQYFISFGAVGEEMDSYDELGKISKSLDDADRYFIFKLIKIPQRYNVSDNYKFKEALVKYGALSIGVISHDRGNEGDYNNKTSAAYYYTNQSLRPDHEVTLVGWDDKYSAANFKNTPPGDGAWIVKNSWGSDWGDGGYYYVSYYDSGILTGDGAVAYELVNPNSFEKVYQYDTNGGVLWARKTSRNLTEEELNLPREKIAEIMENITIPSIYANTYKATGNDLIAAIGTYMFYKDKEYTIWISVNGKEVYTQSGKASHMGFEVIDLNSYVSVKAGDTFTVKIKSFISPQIQARNKVQSGMSYSDDGGSWKDLTSDDSVASIKCYSLSQSKAVLDVSDVNVVYANNAEVTVSLLANGVPVVGADVKVTFNGKTYEGVTGKSGKAVLIIPAKVVPKKYTAKITSGTVSKTFKITVKKATPKLTAKKKKFKKSKKVKKYTVTFKSNVGKAMKNAKLTIKIGKKTYKAKTNAKGKATFKIKKLTKKGKYNAVITYKGDKCYNKVTKKVKITIK